MVVTKNEEKYLFDVPSNYALELYNDKKINNLSELASALKTMSDEAFGYHVSFQKNDFSFWIRKVIGDKKLAFQVKNVGTPQRMAAIIDEKLSLIKESVLKEKERLHKKERKLKQEKEKKIKLEKSKNANSGSKPESDDISPEELLRKESAILEKEREIIFREEKIKEMEDHIENRLRQIPGVEEFERRSRMTFTKHFIQGIIVGILIVILGFFIYWRFFLGGESLLNILPIAK